MFLLPMVLRVFCACQLVFKKISIAAAPAMRRHCFYSKATVPECLRPPSRSLINYAFVACLMLLLCVSANAQVLIPTDSLAPPIPGAGHDYLGNLNETVNPENGAVSLRLGVPVPPGRKLNLPFSFNYDSAGVLFYQGNWELGYGLRSSYQSAPFAIAGWSYGLPRLDNFTQTFSAPFPQGVTPDGSTVCGVTTNYTFVDANGSSHQLGLSHIYDDGPGYYGNENYQCENSHFGEADTSVMDPAYQAALTNFVPGSNPDADGPNDGQPEVAGPDGTLYVFPPSGCGTPYSPDACSRLPSGIEDRNGNILSFTVSGEGLDNPQVITSSTVLNGFSVTDTAGRTAIAGSNFGQTGSTVAVSGFSQPFTVTWTTPTFAGYSIDAQNVSGSEQSEVCSPTQTLSTGSQTQSFISSITLPNGKAYQFTADPEYGTLGKITYPSGGYIRYVYGLNTSSANVNYNGLSPNGSGTVPGACEALLDTVAVAHRYVSFDGSTEVMQQDFNYAPTTWNGLYWTKKQTSVVTHDLLLHTAFTTTYTYVPIYIYPPPNGGGTSEAAVEQQIVYSDTTGSVLKTVTKGWADQYTLTCEVDTIGSSGPSSAVFYTYGPGDVVTDKKEYDYGLVGSSSCYNGATAPTSVTPTRETKITYQPFGITTFQSASLLDAPCEVQVLSGSVVISQTNSYYDAGTSLCGTAGTPSVAAVSNLNTATIVTHDEAKYGPNVSTSRGDLTRQDRLITTGQFATTTATYDETGQETSSTDPCGNGSCSSDMIGTTHTTSYSYSDRYSSGSPLVNTNAYLTQVTYPAVNVPHQEQFYYSFADGHLTEAVDENLQPTYYAYNTPPCGLTDGLDRLSSVTFPDNGQITYCYNDTAPSPTVTTSQLINTSNAWKTSVSIMDGLGHVVHTQLTSDPMGADDVDTTYDGEGRIWTVTNPYRGTPNGTTKYYYDALNRKIETLEQDSVGTLQWCYNGIPSSPAVANCISRLGSVPSGSWVDSTDENGNHVQRTSDSFGRLTEVMEPNGASQSLTMETDYVYDGRNDLVSVTQWGGAVNSANPRSRSFVYDDLSRLTSATNPETGTVGYNYDLNSNLVTKTDARAVATNYTYDDLNRSLSKIYSGDSSCTPWSYYQYDLSTTSNGVGRLSNEWTQKSTASSCASTAPNSGFYTMRSVLAYDRMGRLLNEQQYTLASQATERTYAPSYTYDLAGNLITSTDGTTPSPTTSGAMLTFTNGYDGAEHLVSLTSNWGDPNHPATLFSLPSGQTPCTSAVACPYTAFGALQNAIYGGGVLTLGRTYDTRMRFSSETDVGSNAAATSGTATVTITGSEQSKP
jgi:YD repeat-containing protein